MKKIVTAVVPEKLDLRKRRLELMIWSFLLSLAYYPDYFGFIVWFALFRPFMIIASLKGREAFNAAYYFSFFFTLFSIYWIGMVTPPGMIAAVFIVAFYYTAIFYVFNKVYNFKKIYGLILLPFLWVGMEYFRTLSEFAFPWSDLGYTQSYYLYIIQIVSITSVHGLSFLIVVVNILIWQLFNKELTTEKRLTSMFSATAVIILLCAFGWVVVPKYPLPGEVDVTILQGSLSLKEKWARGNAWRSFQLYDSLAVSTSDSSMRLYVWPETSAPTYLSLDTESRRLIGKTARATNGYHLVGSLSKSYRGEKERYFNSCYQFNPDGQLDMRYDKIKLVPFSEHVPYQDYLPFLEKGFLRQYLTFIGKDVQWWSDFYPGDSLKLFEYEDHRYVVLICFESTFPEYSRKAILDGADFIVGITNDTWFGQSIGIHMHSRIFITRMIENRSWGVRSANTGLSYFVDGYGRIREELPMDQPGVLRSKLNLLDGFSVFTKYGDLIGLLSFLITISLIGILIIQWLIRKIILRKP